MPRLGRQWSKLQALTAVIEAAEALEPHPRLAQMMQEIALHPRYDWRAVAESSKRCASWGRQIASQGELGVQYLHG